MTDGGASSSQGLNENASSFVSDLDGSSENAESTKRGRLGVQRRGASLVIVLYVLISGIVWAAGTPLAGVPDEPAHVVYAAAIVSGASGEIVSNTSGTGGLLSYTVPEWITSLPNKPGSPCYAFDAAVTADCQSPLSESDYPATALTSVSRYQPVYYWIVGIPSVNMAGSRALYAMRAVSVVLATSLIGLGLAAAAPGRRWWLSVGVLIAFTPMVAFLIGGVNPNGAEIAAAIGLAVAVLGVEGDPPTTRRVWFQVAAISLLGGYLAWARPYSWLNLVVVVGATFLFNRRSVVAWIRRRPMAATVTGLSIGLATLTAMSYDVLVQDPVRSTLKAGQSLAHPPVRFVEILESGVWMSGAFLADTIGRFGWLDHSVPRSLQMVWLMFLGALVVMAAVVGKGRDRLLLLAVVAGSTIVTPVVVMQLEFGSPWGYQARYALPLVVLIGLSSMFVLGLRWVSYPERLLPPILGGLGIFAPLTMAISVMWSMARYSLGTPVVWSNVLALEFLRDAAWLPPAVALGVVIVGLAALAALTPALRRVGVDTTTTRFEDSQSGE